MSSAGVRSWIDPAGWQSMLALLFAVAALATVSTVGFSREDTAA